MPPKSTKKQHDNTIGKNNYTQLFYKSLKHNFYYTVIQLIMTEYIFADAGR